MYEEWHNIIFQKRARAILCILVQILQNVRRVAQHYFSKTCSCNTLYSSSNSAKRQSASKGLLHYSGVVLKRVIHVHAVFLQKIHRL